MGWGDCHIISSLGQHSVPTDALGLIVVGQVALDVVQVDAVAVLALLVPEAGAARDPTLGTPQSGERHWLVAAVAFALKYHTN